MHLCKFCQKEMQYATLQELREYCMDIYFCNTCTAEFIYWNNGQISNYNIYCNIDEQYYRFSNYGFSASLWKINEIGVPGSKRNGHMFVIKTFLDYVPDITPENVKRKIKNYLLLL